MEFSSCSLQRPDARWNFLPAACSGLMPNGIFFLQPAAAQCQVEFSSCSLQRLNAQWNFLPATCSDLMPGGIFFLQLAAA
jgi:hypothetical protein